MKTNVKKISLAVAVTALGFMAVTALGVMAFILQYEKKLMDRDWTALCGRSFETVLQFNDDHSKRFRGDHSTGGYSVTLTYTFSEDLREHEYTNRFDLICDSVTVTASKPLKTRYGTKFAEPTTYKMHRTNIQDHENNLFWFYAYRDTITKPLAWFSDDRGFREILYLNTLINHRYVRVSEPSSLDAYPNLTGYLGIENDDFSYFSFREPR